MRAMRGSEREAAGRAGTSFDRSKRCRVSCAIQPARNAELLPAESWTKTCAGYYPAAACLMIGSHLHGRQRMLGALLLLQ